MKAVYLKPQERGSGATRHKLEQFTLFFISEAFHNSPKDFNDRMISRIASYDKCTHCIKSKIQAKAGFSYSTESVRKGALGQ
jgi:hypothetical protein